MAYSGSPIGDSLQTFIQTYLGLQNAKRQREQQAFQNNMATQRLDFDRARADEDSGIRRLQYESLNEDRAARQKAGAVTNAAKTAGNLRIGQEISPETQQALSAGDMADLIKGPTLSSRNIFGAVQAGPKPSVDLQSVANPGKGPTYTGTPVQQEDLRQDEAFKSLLETASPDMKAKLQLLSPLDRDKRTAGLTETIKQEKEKPEVPVMRVNPRTGKMELVGNAPAGAHFVNEPAPSGGAQGLTPVQKATQTRLLRNDYQKYTAPSREIDRQLNAMESGLSQARGGNLNAGSQAVLVTFQKILDPTSVVRESEYARSQAGLGLMQKIEGLVPRLTQGGPGVPLSELEQFAKLARTFASNARKVAQRNALPILAQADELGIDRSRILTEQRADDLDAAPDVSVGSAPSGGGKITVMDPTGTPHIFDTQKQADEFKRLAGIK